MDESKVTPGLTTSKEPQVIQRHGQKPVGTNYHPRFTKPTCYHVGQVNSLPENRNEGSTLQGGPYFFKLRIKGTAGQLHSHRK